MDANSWSDLNHDILDCIIHKLDFVDTFHFLATCRSWHSSVEIHFNRCSLCPKARTPWLLFSSHYDLKNKMINRHLRFYDITSAKFYNIPVIDSLSNLIAVIGSSNGFLIVVDSAYDIHIINPMTRAYYSLPRSCSTIINHFTYSCILSEIKVVIDIRRTTSITFSIGLLVNNVIMFANFGDASWTQLVHTGVADYENDDYFDEDIDDAIFHNEKLYLICGSGTYVLDLKNRFELLTNLQFDRIGHPWNYLVKSPNVDDLFLVIRNAKYVEDEKMLRWVTLNFEVYKFDDTQSEWDVVKDLGEYALFVGPNTFFFLPNSECSIDVKKNTICFMDEMDGDGVGVFDLVDGSIKRFDLHDDLKWNAFQKAFWFTPTLV